VWRYIDNETQSQMIAAAGSAFLPQPPALPAASLSRSVRHHDAHLAMLVGLCLDLPARPGGGVLHGKARRGQHVAQQVGAGEVLGVARGRVDTPDASPMTENSITTETELLYLVF